MQQRRWETVFETNHCGPSLQRFPVPGGWLYRTILYTEHDDQVALAFVPKPESTMRRTATPSTSTASEARS